MVGSGVVWYVLVRLGEVGSGEARYSGEIFSAVFERDLKLM
jgi:hypothetical protein